MRGAVLAWASWRRVAVAGLLALLAATLVGALLPDPLRLSSAELADLAASRPRTLALARLFPAGRILGSPWLMVVPVTLAVAIAWNVVGRIRRRGRGGAGLSPRFNPHRAWVAPGSPDAVAERLSQRLSRRGYRVEVVPSGDAREVVARRGALGFWGSIAFHVGLIFALVAVTATLVGEWRGVIHLVEGDRVALDAPGVVRVERRGPLAPEISHTPLLLTKCDVTYQDDRFPVDYRATVAALEDSGALRETTIRVNESFVIERQRLRLSAFGIAPVLVVHRGPERLAAAPVSLSVREGNEDEIDIPGTRDRVRVRWYGDLVQEGRTARSRSDEARNPALGLTLDGTSVLLRRGESVQLGPYRLAFPESRYWVDLGIEHDPGVPVLLVALLLVSGGIAVRYWDHEREIRASVRVVNGRTHVAAAARSRYFPALIARELGDLEATT